MNESIIFESVSFVCPICDYNQDTDPSLPYQQSPDMFPKVPLSMCPTCYAKGQENQLVKHSDTDEGSRTKITVASDSSLEAMMVEDLDANGYPIMEETGEVRYQFDPMTGQINPVAVMQPKMVPAPKEQVDALKLQRDQNLDALEKIAV